MKRWQSLLLGAIITAAALYFSLRGAQLGEIAALMRGVRYQYVLGGAAIIAASTYVRGLRWRALLQNRLSGPRGFWLFNTGFLFNNLLPFHMGELVRAYLAARRPPLRFAGALSSIVVERLMDMLTAVAMLAVLLLVPGLNVPAWATSAGLIMLAGACAGMALLYALARKPRWLIGLVSGNAQRLPLLKRAPERVAGQVESFLDGLASLRDPRAFFTALGYSALAWTMTGVAGWVILFAFADFGTPGIEIGFLTAAASALALSLPSLPGGVGPYEAAVTLSMVAVGFGQEEALSYAVVLHAANFLTAVVLGALGLLQEGLSFGQVVSAARRLGDEKPEPLTAET